MDEKKDKFHKPKMICYEVGKTKSVKEAVRKDVISVYKKKK